MIFWIHTDGRLGNLDKKLESLLAARELRWKQRLYMAATSPGCLITVSLRVPWKYRTSQDFLQLMEKLCEILHNKLTMQNVGIVNSRWIIGQDGPVLFLWVGSDAKSTKRLCIQAEESLTGGHLLDIDVMNRDGMAVSRKLLGFTPRKCFVCDKPAIVCASRRLHSSQELDAAIEKSFDQALSALG